MDDDRDRKEEEARQEADGRRRHEPLIDYEWHDITESRLRRGSRAEHIPQEPEQDLDRSLDRDLERDPDLVQQRVSTLDRTRGLYGSQIGSNILRSAIAEFVGTFILVFTGTAVATAAILQPSTAGPGFYDSLAVSVGVRGGARRRDRARLGSACQPDRHFGASSDEQVPLGACPGLCGDAAPGGRPRRHRDLDRLR